LKLRGMDPDKNESHIDHQAWLVRAVALGLSHLTRGFLQIWTRQHPAVWVPEYNPASSATSRAGTLPTKADILIEINTRYLT
jgi:hypothetical protein